MKNLLAACLLLASLSASAQTWTRYAQTDDATIYFDHLRTRKIGDVAFVWDLHDLSAPLTQADGKPFRSALYAVEYNCRAKNVACCRFCGMLKTWARDRSPQKKFRSVNGARSNPILWQVHCLTESANKPN